METVLEIRFAAIDDFFAFKKLSDHGCNTLRKESKQLERIRLRLTMAKKESINLVMTVSLKFK